MNVRVARLLAPVTVLGPGRRLGLWVQGCGLACPGCASRDTWDPAEGLEIPVAELADRITRTVVAEDLTGLTITGGEPTDQGRALASLSLPTCTAGQWLGACWEPRWCSACHHP